MILIINLLVQTSLGSTCLWSAQRYHPPPRLGGSLGFCRTTHRYAANYYVYLLRRIQHSVLWMNNCLSYYHFSCLTALPLFLCSLTSRISNCLSLLFGTQGRPRRLKPFSTSNEQGTRRCFCTWEGPQIPVLFQSLLFFDTVQS